MSCGIEAAARVAASTANEVLVLATYADEWAQKDSKNLQELPIKYERLDFDAVTVDTPYEYWFRSGAWKEHTSPYQVPSETPSTCHTHTHTHTNTALPMTHHLSKTVRTGLAAARGRNTPLPIRCPPHPTPF